jgi:hypothetical protein
MAFEKGSLEHTFFETLKKFEEETYRLDMQHKQNKARREFTQKIDRHTNRKNLMETVELYDRVEQAIDLESQLEGLFNSIDNQFEIYLKQILELGAARAKLNESSEICNWLTIFVKGDAPELIEEQMNQKFGNEHVWKKEFPAEFLKMLRAYSKNPTNESKNNLLWRISVLNKANVRRSASVKTLMNAGNEIPVSEMTFEETTEAFNATCEKIDDLRLLEVSTANLYNDLEKIKTRVLE